MDPADDGCLCPPRSEPSAWASLERRARMDVPARPGRLWRAARYTDTARGFSHPRRATESSRCAAGAPAHQSSKIADFAWASARAVTFFRRWISISSVCFKTATFSRPFAFRPGIFGSFARGSNLARVVPGKTRGVARPGRPPRFDQEGFRGCRAVWHLPGGRPPSRRVRLARAATHGPRSSVRIPRARRLTTGARRAWIPTRGAERERARARRTRSVAASLGGVRAWRRAFGISDG